MALEELKQLEPNGFKVADLFCGAGIGAWGFKKAGFDMVWGVDNDKYAVLTYNLNIGNHAICEDIRKIKVEDIPQCDILVATPVCKPFSICGVRRLTNDEKYGDLLAETIRIFSGVKPKALFFENVAGIALADSLPIFREFVKEIESYGYHAYWDIINSWHLGVPQERERVYMVAIRDDIKYEFIPPCKTFNRTTQRDALWDLRDNTNVKNHNLDKLPYKIYETLGVNTRQSDWDSPAKTILSHRDSILFYPEPKYIKGEVLPRKMTVREHLRLQTVEDEFYFPDSISLNEQYNRCSGVPSLVAYKYGKAIMECLLGKTPLRGVTHKTIVNKPLFSIKK